MIALSKPTCAPIRHPTAIRRKFFRWPKVTSRLLPGNLLSHVSHKDTHYYLNSINSRFTLCRCFRFIVSKR